MTWLLLGYYNLLLFAMVGLEISVALLYFF